MDKKLACLFIFILSYVILAVLTTNFSILFQILKFLDFRLKKLDKPFIIGLSTGRSGTAALAAILNLQKKACVLHEFEQCRLTPWEGANYKHGHYLMRQKIDKILEYCRVKIRLDHKFEPDQILTSINLQSEFSIGEIASWNLPYFEFLLNLRRPPIKFIGLIRNKQDTIKSWKNWTAKKHKFHWCGENTSCWAQNRQKFNTSNYDSCFPDLSGNFKNLSNFSVEEAVEIYYDQYNFNLTQWAKMYPKRVKIFDTYEVLNDSKVLLEAFRWLEIDGPYEFDSKLRVLEGV